MCAEIKMCSNRKSIPLMTSYLYWRNKRINKEIPNEVFTSSRKPAENNFEVAKINFSLSTLKKPDWLCHQT